MSDQLTVRPSQSQRQGLTLLIGIVALMWVIEVVNTLDSNNLDFDGIYPRNFDRLWGVFSAPFLARQLRAPDPTRFRSCSWERSSPCGARPGSLW